MNLKSTPQVDVFFLNYPSSSIYLNIQLEFDFFEFQVDLFKMNEKKSILMLLS